MTGRPKILIVYGYHPKEIFATKVGEYLLRDFSSPDIKVVRYTGRPDSETSSHCLRKFIKKFDPVILPLILHGDDDMGCDAAIIYIARSKQEETTILKPLSDFCSKHSCGRRLIPWGRFLFHRANYSIIEMELNSKMRLQRAAELVMSFSQYLLNLFSEKNLKL